MDVQDCFEKGLLRKESPDVEKVRKSLETANRKLSLAKRLVDFKIFEETILNAYSAMFHSSRALLFKDGVREKSHYAVFIYLKEKYADQMERRFINELNTLRLERHEISYGLEKPEITEDEAKEIIVVAGDFITAVKRIIQNGS